MAGADAAGVWDSERGRSRSDSPSSSSTAREAFSAEGGEAMLVRREELRCLRLM